MSAPVNVQRWGSPQSNIGAAREIPITALSYRHQPPLAAGWEEPTFRRSSSLDVATLDTEGARGTVFVAQPAPSWVERTHFETSSMPAVVVQRVIEAIQAAGGEVNCVKPQKSKVKCSVCKDFVNVNFHVTVFRNTSEQPTAAYVVEFQKRAGDSFIWNNVYSSLLESLRDLSATQIPAANVKAEAQQLRIIDGIHPQELAALAAEMVTIDGPVETLSIAARAYSVATSTQEARRLAGKCQDEDDIWGNEISACKKQRIEDSLQALKEVTDGSGEISRCLQSTLSSLNRQSDTISRAAIDQSVPRQPWSSRSSASNLDMWCRPPETVMILSSSA